MKWIYRHPRIYNLVDTIINLGLSNKARAQLVSSLKGKVLEVGIGSGKSISYFNGEEFCGIDNSIFMLRKTKRRNNKLCVASAYNLPFKGHSFDKVVFIYTLRVLENQDKALEEAFRVGNEVIVLEFNTLPNIFEAFGKKVFGSYNLSSNLLKSFIHKRYINRFVLHTKI